MNEITRQIITIAERWEKAYWANESSACKEAVDQAIGTLKALRGLGSERYWNYARVYLTHRPRSSDNGQSNDAMIRFFGYVERRCEP